MVYRGTFHLLWLCLPQGSQSQFKWGRHYHGVCTLLRSTTPWKIAKSSTFLRSQLRKARWGTETWPLLILRESVLYSPSQKNVRTVFGSHLYLCLLWVRIMAELHPCSTRLTSGNRQDPPQTCSQSVVKTTISSFCTIFFFKMPGQMKCRYKLRICMYILYVALDYTTALNI